MKQLSGLDVTLQDQLLLNKEQQNMDYLMELESDALLQNFTQERDPTAQSRSRSPLR